MAVITDSDLLGAIDRDLDLSRRVLKELHDRADRQWEEERIAHLERDREKLVMRMPVKIRITAIEPDLLTMHCIRCNYFPIEEKTVVERVQCPKCQWTNSILEIVDEYENRSRGHG